VFWIIIFLGILNGCSNSTTNSNGLTKGDGKIVSQEKFVSDFNSVTLKGGLDVNIYYAEDFKVLVTTDSNIQNFVVINVNKNVLNIDIKTNSYFSATELYVDVYLPELKTVNLEGVGNIKIADGETTEFDIILSGGGNIDVQDFEAENVNIDLSGVGDIKFLNGKTSDFKVDLSGGGNIDVQNFDVENVNIKHSGVGNIKFKNGKISDFTIILTGGGNIDAQNLEAENVNINHSGVGDLKIWATDSLAINFSGGGDIYYKGNPTINNLNTTGVGQIIKM